MASDDLEAPLGLAEGKKRRRLPLGPPIAGLLVLCLVGFAGWALFFDDPFGGEPMVVLSLNPGASAPAAPAGAEGGAVAAAPGGDKAPSPADGPPSHRAETASRPAAAPSGSAAKTAAAGPTVTIIDGTSGARQEVVLPSGDGARALAIDQRILEATRHGQAPRVGLDGARASHLYARPAPPSAPSAAKIAIVIGGLGVSANGTAAAIDKLPPAVTLAFVPYGGDLERLVGRARADGHEILLQIPMEPFDYPENDPGPQTLLTALAPDQNIDRMHWAMSRFQGYVGIANYLGARFTATEAAMAPVLRETAKRGLIFVDDGSSPRSIAGQIAGANNLPFAKANVVIDAVPSQAEVERALARLEDAARENGVAVGYASPLPLSIERIAQWAKSAEARGFALVPITALAIRPKGS